jgi:hypothetical protein
MVGEPKELARSVVSLADKRKLWDVEAAVDTPCQFAWQLDLRFELGNA